MASGNVTLFCGIATANTIDIILCKIYLAYH